MSAKKIPITPIFKDLPTVAQVVAMSTATIERLEREGQFPKRRQLSGQRIGDVLSIRLADIDEAGIFFRQKKTGNRLRVTMTPDLARTIAAARALHTSVHGLTLFHTRGGKPFAYWTIRTLWERATLAAGIADAHIHDMRAKAATDAKAQGLDSKALLGHASESSHLRYLRSKETPEAQPPKLRQSKT